MKAGSYSARLREKAVSEGKALAETNYARCHAPGASGLSPNPKAAAFRVLKQRHPILALREPLSRGIAAPHDEKPKFAMPEADIDRIESYIDKLQARSRGWDTNTKAGGR